MTKRLLAGYVAAFAIAGALAATSFVLGADKKPQPSVAGVYVTSGGCFGKASQFELKQSGQFVEAGGLTPPEVEGSLRLRHSLLTGTVTCAGGDRARLTAVRDGSRNEARPTLHGDVGGISFDAIFVKALPKPGVPTTKVGGANPPSNEAIFGRLMLAIAAVLIAARLVAAAIGRIGQPPVMGEVLAGILLGPTFLGAIAPGIEHYLFPPFVIPLLTAAADIGLVFYMFMVGLELDTRLLRGRIAHAAAISNASVVIPLGLGIAVALPLYSLLGTPDSTYPAFALFLGVALAITAFPVLARILLERRMLGHPIGALALSSAAVDDVTAWGLLVVASGIAGRGSAYGSIAVLGYVLAFCLGMALIARPLLNRVSAAYDEAGSVPAGWITAIFVGVLLAAYISMKTGVAPIFGAFLMGLVMPRRADLSHDVTRRLEDFVTRVLLPLFFVVTGLKTDVGLLNRPILWGLTLLLIVVAVAGKWLAAMGMARLAGYPLRDSAVLGALMNTRGLTELIVLNIGLELGVISPTLFTMLVIMALVTTFMTAPAIRALDPRHAISAPVSDALPAARPATPQGSLLVAALAEENVAELLAVGEPLARSAPPRELILVRALEPPRAGAPLAKNDRELARADQVLERARARLAARGVSARSVSFTSSDRAADLVRLAADENVDLIVMDGHRPLLGSGIPRGDVGAVLATAACDVAVLVDQDRAPTIDGEHPVCVAAGEGGHDRAALELGRQIAHSTGATLRQIDSQAGLPEAAHAAGLMIVGLPDQWRKQGLGRVRGTLSRSAREPTLFVRSRDGEK